MSTKKQLAPHAKPTLSGPASVVGNGTDSAPYAVLLLNDTGQIVRFNRAAEILFGYTSAEALGQPVRSLISVHCRSTLDATMHRLARSGEGVIQMPSFAARRHDGSEFDAAGMISVIEGEAAVSYMAVFHDAGTRGDHERRLRFLADVGAELGKLDCESAVRAVAEAAVAGFADTCVASLHEAEGCKAQLHILHAEGMADWSGRALLAPGTLMVRDLLRTAVRAGAPSLLPGSAMAALPPGPMRRSDGALRRSVPAGLAVPIVIGGKTAGSILCISWRRAYGDYDLDVAERAAQRAAAALENARTYAAAKRALKAHDETLSFVSHDLRNPLNVILMAADLLLDTALPEDARLHWLRAITHSAQQMNTLISDLLTAARAEAGTPALHPRVARVDLLLREAATGLEHSALARGIHLDTEAPDPSLLVVADVDAIVRALSNLIGNAVKHTPQGGTVTVRAVRKAGQVEFSVSDTGHGIQQDHIPHLFERFWQAPGTRRGGAGLGLAIVKGVVEAHHGSVYVESELGSGSTFRFTIPSATGREAGDPAPLAENEAAARR